MAKKHVHALTFDSLGEAVQAAESTAKPLWESRSSRSSEDEKWSGSRSFEEACSLARHGWPEGRSKMVRAVSTAARFAGFSTTPAYSLDVAGAYPHCAIAAAGDAFCMVAPSPVSERSKPIVRLVLSGAVSAMVNPEEIFNYGAALLAFVDGLEASDIRTELSLLYTATTRDDSELMRFSIRIKGAEEALDLDRMSFAIASPAMWRRVTFSLMELHLSEKWASGYGVPRDASPSDYDSDCILLPSAQSFRGGSLRSPEQAFAAVAPSVEALLRDRFASFPPLSFESREAA